MVTTGNFPKLASLLADYHWSTFARDSVSTFGINTVNLMQQDIASRTKLVINDEARFKTQVALGAAGTIVMKVRQICFLVKVDGVSLGGFRVPTETGKPGKIGRKSRNMKNWPKVMEFCDRS